MPSNKTDMGVALLLIFVTFPAFIYFVFGGIIKAGELRLDHIPKYAWPSIILIGLVLLMLISTILLFYF